MDPASVGTFGTVSEERSFLREAMREERAQKHEAVGEWLQGRHKIGAASWTDKDALRHLRIAVSRALLQDDWRDVLAAIRRVSRDPLATPWRVPVIAAEIGGARREREHMDRKLHERAEGYGTGV